MKAESAKCLKNHVEKGWWISARYCSLKALWSGMGEVVPASTSQPYIPHPPSPLTML